MDVIRRNFWLLVVHFMVALFAALCVREPFQCFNGARWGVFDSWCKQSTTGYSKHGARFIYCHWNGWIHWKQRCVGHRIARQKYLCLSLMARFVQFHLFLRCSRECRHTHTHMHGWLAVVCLTYSVTHTHLLSSCGWLAARGFFCNYGSELSFAWQMVQHHAASGNRDNHLSPHS